MGFDPVTYALSQNATGTLSLQNENMQEKLNALSAVLYSRGFPLYANVYGNGVINVRDAAAGRIDYIQVDSELAGQTLYVQISNASGITDYNEPRISDKKTVASKLDCG